MAPQVLCPVMIGRDTELAAVEAALRAATAGHGGCVLITGEPGIGKSRLALETVPGARAPRGPGRARAGRAPVGDRALPAADRCAHAVAARSGHPGGPDHGAVAAGPD